MRVRVRVRVRVSSAVLTAESMPATSPNAPSSAGAPSSVGGTGSGNVGTVKHGGATARLTSTPSRAPRS